MDEHTAQTKQAAMRRKVYIGVLVFALCMSLLFAGGIVYEKVSRWGERVRIAYLLKDVSYVVLYATDDQERGEDVVRAMRLTDPQFKAIPNYGQSCDELFVLAPTTRGSVYLLERDAPRRIIAWSKNIYEGDRLILWSDYSIYWVPDERVDLIARTVQESAE